MLRSIWNMQTPNTYYNTKLFHIGQLGVIRIIIYSDILNFIKNIKYSCVEIRIQSISNIHTDSNISNPFYLNWFGNLYDIYCLPIVVDWYRFSKVLNHFQLLHVFMNNKLFKHRRKFLREGVNLKSKSKIFFFFVMTIKLY